MANRAQTARKCKNRLLGHIEHRLLGNVKKQAGKANRPQNAGICKNRLLRQIEHTLLGNVKKQAAGTN